MVLYPGGGPGKSTAVNSPRHLTIRNTRRLVAAGQRAQGLPLSFEELASNAVATVQTIAAGENPDRSKDILAAAAGAPAAIEGASEAGDDDETLNTVLKPGQEQVFSYWAPGLKAGKQHHVRVTQTINGHQDGDKPLLLQSDKSFFVDAPQFSLPADAVHSVYPPQGYQDDARILPHVVLTDPHLPWERIGSQKAEAADEAAAKSGLQPRNKVPWLVLLSFTQQELALPPGTLNGTGSIFEGTTAGLVKPVKQSTTMTVGMSIADLWATKNIVTPITKDSGPDTIKDARGDFIFLKPDLFLELFCSFDENGARESPPVINTVPYSLLSHVRHVNAAGMALAGVEDSAVFSIVVGSRAGPLDITTPATVSVHLLSVEGVEGMGVQFAPTTEYVAMCSLHSWNYTVNPPGMVNVYETFTSLGRTLDVLRPPEKALEPLLAAKGETRTKEQLRVGARMKDGYSVVKHRLQTGEDTVAFFRGPFTPTVVGAMAPIRDRCSNSGMDLQILDPVLGIMDITYSSAWQLGRVLALGDEGFTTALGRLRTAIHRPAMKQAKISAIRAIDPLAYRSKRALLSDLPSLVRGLADIQTLGNAPQHAASLSAPGGGEADDGQDSHDTASEAVGEAQFEPGGVMKRWSRRRLPRRKIPDLSFSSPGIESRYPDAAERSAKDVSASTDGGVYDETNVPVSTDWMVVMTWLLGKMFLDGVPAHYLITDPSHLPEESLRFFYIDPNWVDAFIDGALSLGNHRGRDEDRVAIKKAFNRRITSTPEHTDFTPQIPTYGFFLRSDLVSMYPDLRVTTLPPRGELPPGVKDRAPLLRHTIIADGVMLGLLDRVPGSTEFNGLVLTQPPHQQRFSIGDSLDKTQLTVNIRRQYTTPQAGQTPDQFRHKTLPPSIENKPLTAGNPNNNLFTWGSKLGLNDLRTMRISHFAAQQIAILQGPWPKDPKDPEGPPGGELSPEGKRYFQDDTATSALLAMQLSDPTYSLTIPFKETTTAGVRLASLLPPPPDGPPDPAIARAAVAGSGPDAGAATSSSARTLTSLQPPVLQKLVAHADSGVASAEDSADEAGSQIEESGTGDDSFTHPPGYLPPNSASSAHGPQVMRIPVVTTAPGPAGAGDDAEVSGSGVIPQASKEQAQPRSVASLATTTAASSPTRALRTAAKLKDGGAAGMPSFKIKVYTRGVDSGVVEIPQDPTKQLAQDLIFSIQATDNDNGDAWKLMELDIAVPLGPAAVDEAAAAAHGADYFLMSRYAGPGATMLRNLRFNVLVALVTPGHNPYLQLRLLPRAREGFIPIDKVDNISFLLALADINRWDGKIPRDAQPGTTQGAAGGSSVSDWSPPPLKQLHLQDGVKAQYHPRSDANPPRSQPLEISVFMRG